MKMLRKNIDLTNETVAILQIEATLAGFGSLKPFLEKIVSDFAAKCSKGRPGVYGKVVSQKTMKANQPAKTKLRRRTQ
jgi:hypothetical protein